jgi:hypothetical protein
MSIFVFFPNNLNFVADQVQLSTPKEFKTIGIRFRRNRKSHFICLYRVIPKYFKKNSYIHPILQNQIDTYFLCFMYKRVFGLLITNHGFLILFLQYILQIFVFTHITIIFCPLNRFLVLTNNAIKYHRGRINRIRILSL